MTDDSMMDRRSFIVKLGLSLSGLLGLVLAIPVVGALLAPMFRKVPPTWRTVGQVDQFEKRHGTKLGFMSFFVKAVADALKQFPIINASVDGTDIVYHGYYDIGIAVNSPRGLVVPIIRDVEQLSFAEIESAIGEKIAIIVR